MSDGPNNEVEITIVVDISPLATKNRLPPMGLA